MIAVGVEMIVEDAADAALHVAVGDEEIVLRPFREARIVADRRMRVAGGLQCRVEVGGVLARRESAG